MQSTELRIKQNPKSSILKSPHIQQKIYIKELSKKKKLIMWLITQIYQLSNFNAIMLQFNILGVYLAMIC